MRGSCLAPITTDLACDSRLHRRVRRGLGEVAAEAMKRRGDAENKVEKTRTKYLRAPVIIGGRHCSWRKRITNRGKPRCSCRRHPKPLARSNCHGTRKLLVELPEGCERRRRAPLRVGVGHARDGDHLPWLADAHAPPIASARLLRSRISPDQTSSNDTTSTGHSYTHASRVSPISSSPDSRTSLPSRPRCDDAPRDR